MWSNLFWVGVCEIHTAMVTLDFVIPHKLTRLWLLSRNKMENMSSVAETIFFFPEHQTDAYTHIHFSVSSTLSLSLHLYVILSPSWVVVTSVVHQSLKVDFFFLLHFHVSFFLFFCQTAIVTYWASKKWKIFMQACNTCNEVSAWPSVWLIL